MITNVDICCGLAWGDEAKGKIVLELLKKKKYDYVCRWNGGSNAGHTIYINNNKYHTHIIPTGIFYGIKSYIGSDCYVNMEQLDEEMCYLKKHGFDISLVKISPRAHLVSNEHVQLDLLKYKNQQGSTGKGIAPCAKDKFGRIGILVKDGIWEKYKSNLWDEKKDKLFGEILCEGAQGFWLDINHGNYPFVTSSYTLPYSACSLGFPPQKIRNIYGAVKIYDTRVGKDPLFDSVSEDQEILDNIAIIGNEYGTTTGRPRKVRWLDLDLLVNSINISGCTHIIISKIDIIKKINIFKMYTNNTLKCYSSYDDMIRDLENILNQNCSLLEKIIYSDNPKTISI